MTARNLKHVFDANLVREIASELSRADPAFNAAGFVASGLDGLDRLELTQRAWHLAEALRKHLPRPFSRAADLLVASLGPELSRTDAFGLSPMRYMPHVFFVQRYGLDDFEAARRARRSPGSPRGRRISPPPASTCSRWRSATAWRRATLFPGAAHASWCSPTRRGAAGDPRSPLHPAELPARRGAGDHAARPGVRLLT